MIKANQPVRWFVFTLILVISNYIAFYLDDIFMYYGWAETSFTVYGLRALAFPVAWYVEMIEPYTLLSIPVIGRALNYCVELVYFYSLVVIFSGVVHAIGRWVVQPIQTYLLIHEKTR